MMTSFFESQLAEWPLAYDNNEALSRVLTREMTLPGCDCTIHVQHNPARIRSTVARVDAASLHQRPCFLCAANRPAEQRNITLPCGWEVLVNPYPILKEHYVVASPCHQPQTLTSCLPVMQEVAEQLSDEFMVFYNGPHCGASAPDHAHLQAGRWKGVPLVEWVLAQSWEKGVHEASPLGFRINVYVGCMPDIDTDDVNLFIVRQPHDDHPEGRILTVVIPRRRHRPACYFAEDDHQRLISPGALDMCGLLIAPRREDYDTLSPEEAFSLLRECGEWSEPTLHVGIMKAPEIAYEQHGDSFTLHHVTIGRDFHWEQKERQHFYGTLRLVPEDGEFWAVNDIPLEQYLTSVISSEMNAHAPLEFLKVHAIVSRSWLIAQRERKRKASPAADSQGQSQSQRTEQRAQCTTTAGHNHNCIIRWYDHDDHTLFDVCADDHCQRYQGLARITEAAVRAVRATAGQVLTFQGEVVDARYSKCCGGITEEYQTCWDDTPHPELASIRDCDADGHDFCDTHDEALLATVLNHYDRRTHDFYTWIVQSTPSELGALILRKGGIDVGEVLDLVPLERGISGRIRWLRIVGSKDTLEVGKELEIRRLLSPSHLYSSAFTPTLSEGVWTLSGRGWGHGVGMCQIGAAVMASRGYPCGEILKHYYPNSTIEHLYLARFP
jgi:SpoIID/LytB domain protein